MSYWPISSKGLRFSHSTFDRARFPFCSKDGARVGDDAKWQLYKELTAGAPTKQSVSAYPIVGMKLWIIVNLQLRAKMETTSNPQKGLPRKVTPLLLVSPLMMCILSFLRRKPTESMVNSAPTSRSCLILHWIWSLVYVKCLRFVQIRIDNRHRKTRWICSGRTLRTLNWKVTIISSGSRRLVVLMQCEYSTSNNPCQFIRWSCASSAGSLSDADWDIVSRTTHFLNGHRMVFLENAGGRRKFQRIDKAPYPGKETFHVHGLSVTNRWWSLFYQSEEPRWDGNGRP